MMKTDTLNLAAFAENPDNPQTVTDEAYALLVQSIRDTPQTLEAAKIAYCTDYVALDGTDMTGRYIVIAGNKRLRALKEVYGENADVPAAWFFDLTPLGAEARRRWLVKSNIQSGEWDLDKLLAQYSKDELEGLMGPETLDSLLASLENDQAPATGMTDPDATPAPPSEAVSRRGETYALGFHRLACDDAARADDVAGLMDGETANCLITDPPYNVGYVGGTKDALTIENDSMDRGDFVNFLESAFKAADAALAPGGAFYIWHPDSGRGDFLAAMERTEWRCRQVLIWVKNAQIGRAHV